MTTVKIKRAYEPPEKADGFRILVDRLWPRGIKKEELQYNVWLKDIAPTAELRKWFGHKPEKWEGFKERYMNELKRSAAKEELINLCKQHKRITLVYSAKDEEHNQAAVIKAFIEQGL